MNAHYEGAGISRNEDGKLHADESGIPSTGKLIKLATLRERMNTLEEALCVEPSDLGPRSANETAGDRALQASVPTEVCASCKTSPGAETSTEARTKFLFGYVAAAEVSLSSEEHTGMC